MAVDIAPELYKKIHTEFEQQIEKNNWIRNFRSRMKKKKTTANDVSLYAAEVGKCASYALIQNLIKNNLPAGKLYWNIAERTIKPILEEAYAMVLDAAETVQKAEDEKEKINIKPVRPRFPHYRVQDFMNKLILITEEAADGKDI